MPESFRLIDYDLQQLRAIGWDVYYRWESGDLLVTVKSAHLSLKYRNPNWRNIDKDGVEFSEELSSKLEYFFKELTEQQNNS